MPFLNHIDFEAVSEALESIFTDDNGDGYVSAEGMEKIRAAVAAMQAAKDAQAPADLVQLAQDIHGGDEITIDENAAMSITDRGAWVQAWVYVDDWEPAEPVPADLAKASEGFACNGCGRAEAECSANPCPDVIAEREEEVVTSTSEAWEMICPTCKDDSKLEVLVKVWATLSAQGTDTETARDHSHDWDGSSFCQCGCGWNGLVSEARDAWEDAKATP